MTETTDLDRLHRELPGKTMPDGHVVESTHWLGGDRANGLEVRFTDGCDNDLTWVGGAVIRHEDGCGMRTHRHHLEALAAQAKAHADARSVEQVAKGERDDLIREALEAGATYAQVGRATGLSRAMLDRIRHSRA